METLTMQHKPQVISPKPRVMKLIKVLYAGLAATAIMTLFMLISPYIGLPKMDMGEVLGALLGGSALLGWVAHAAIGIIFAFIYAAFFNDLLPIENNISRGAIYGIGVFLYSQVNFTLINLMGLLNWYVKEDVGLMVFGNMLACLIYGAVLGTFFKRQSN